MTIDTWYWVYGYPVHPKDGKPYYYTTSKTETLSNGKSE